MNLRLRILLAFLLIGCFIGGSFVFEQVVLPLVTREQPVLVSGVLLDQVFTKADFRYGPQSWRPYYDPLALDPGQNASPGDTWYMMYISLNGTPVSGNPDVRRLGALKVTYNFSALAGRAVFHTYGSRSDATQARTNRQEGYGRSGYVVHGSHVPGQSMPATTELPLSGSHEYSVIISNVRSENGDDFRAATRTLKFERAGSGLDALHITQNLTTPKGQVTETPDQECFFYITATGENPNMDLLVLVAVNQMQPDGFLLGLKSEFVER